MIYNGVEIEMVKFDKRKCFENILPNYSEIYAVNSEVEKGLIYGISDGYFALITSYDMMRVKYKDLPKLAEKLKESIKEEVMALYFDTKFLFERSRGVWDIK